METQAAFSLCAEVEGRGTVELLTGTMPLRALPSFCLAVARLRDFLPLLSIYVSGNRITMVNYSTESVALLGAEN